MSDLKVTATDPPSQQVQVEIAFASPITAPVIPSGSRTLHHAVVLRGPTLAVIPEVQAEYPAMWNQDGDLLLALVSVPPQTGCVRDEYITDLRSWKDEVRND